MHSQYLGTVKSIINRWIDDDLVTKRWFQAMTSEEKNELKASKLNKTQLSIWDQRLSSIKFPEDVLKAMPQLSQNRSTIDYKLKFGGSSSLSFSAYSDADLGGDRENRNSTTGYLVWLN
ncbi:hypothetical protein DERF_010658 [Dermatophagoides farinae]|uniref:Uncharacterized protein n=1 Tax=Dermatophagoides farinae TaxID=6954 RepID=A0A922HRD1_DERFA|nr:hypothetical protein DERF_010658 [Dermatophagoides farinae]